MRTGVCLLTTLNALALLAAPQIRVVFPPPGASVAAAGITHVLGSVRPADTPLTLNGQTVTVWRTGGFACMAPVVPGTNTLVFRAGKAELRHTFRVPFPPPPWDGQSLRAREPLEPVGVYTGECVRLVCDAPADRTVHAQVGERTVPLAPEPGAPTRYTAQVGFASKAEAAPVTFFSEGLKDAHAAALSARAEWPAVRVTGRLFETRARSEPGEGDTVAFLTPGLCLQSAGFIGDKTRVWLAGTQRFVETRLVATGVKHGAPPPRDIMAPDIGAGFGPHPPTNRTPAQVLIVIDPGHGGDASGAVGPCGIKEKTVTLQQAKVVRKALEAAGFRVRLTRDSDTNPDLYDRTRIAFGARADAFIALHYNATVPSADPRRARNIATYQWNDIGERLAQAIHPQVARATGIADGGVRQASFAVCRNPAVPAILIELDFITVPEAEEAIQSPERQCRVADAIVAGLRTWLALPTDVNPQETHP